MVGAAFLDLFAGSGAVAIEALSNGAARAVLVEKDRRAVAVIKGNLAELGLSEQAELFPVPVDRGLKLLGDRGLKFDLVFIGAPYDSPDLIGALEKLGDGSVLAPGAAVIAERRRQHQIDDEYGLLKSFREVRHGETVLKFYENRSISR